MATKRETALRKPQWFKMAALFDFPSKRVAQVGDGEDVLIKGVRYRAEITCGGCGKSIKVNQLNTKDGGEDKLELMPELAVCVVSRSILEEQGETLRRMLEANLRMPVLLLTDNVHLVKLKPISNAVAKSIMDQAAADDLKALESAEAAAKPVTP